jgi:hypothetical protein
LEDNKLLDCINCSVLSFAARQKKEQSNSKNAYIHFFLLFAGVKWLHKDGFQRAEKQQEKVTTPDCVSRQG